LVTFKYNPNQQELFQYIVVATHFDNPKHFFQNMLATVVNGILEFSSNKENLLIRCNKISIDLRDLALQLIRQAASGFQKCRFLAEGSGQRQPAVDQQKLQQMMDMGFP